MTVYNLNMTLIFYCCSSCPGIFASNCQGCGKGAENVAQFMKHLEYEHMEFGLVHLSLLSSLVDQIYQNLYWTATGHSRGRMSLMRMGAGDTNVYIVSISESGVGRRSSHSSGIIRVKG